MDFRQNLQQAVGVNRNEGSAPAANNNNRKPSVKNLDSSKWLVVLSAVALIGAVLLILVASFAITKGAKTVREAAFVDTSAYQAVFLNNGQVYFGKVNNLNSQYVDLKEVYYLTQATNGEGQTSADYTLVKLGCQQIHYPKDRMFISRDQVTFWENLDTKGKVADSIKQFKEQNPNNEHCNTEATQTQNPAPNAPSQSSNNANTQTNNAANNTDN